MVDISEVLSLQNAKMVGILYVRNGLHSSHIWFAIPSREECFTVGSSRDKKKG
jgi:hypothetical protein